MMHVDIFLEMNYLSMIYFRFDGHFNVSIFMFQCTFLSCSVLKTFLIHPIAMPSLLIIPFYMGFQTL